MSVTNRQRELLRHALGLPSNRTPDRNFFAADPGSPDDEEWQSLVRLGLAFWREGTPTECWPYRYYHVTEAGMAAAKEQA